MKPAKHHDDANELSLRTSMGALQSTGSGVDLPSDEIALGEHQAHRLVVSKCMLLLIDDHIVTHCSRRCHMGLWCWSVQTQATQSTGHARSISDPDGLRFGRPSIREAEAAVKGAGEMNSLLYSTTP